MTTLQLATALIRASLVSSHTILVIYDILKQRRTNIRSLHVYCALYVCTGVCSEVRIVTREEWGARAPTSRTPISTPVSTAYVHHTVTSQCYTQAACEASVRSIQDYHMDALGERTTEVQ